MINLKICNLNKEKIKMLVSSVERLYYLSTILEYFCSTQPEIEELRTLTPLAKMINGDADLVYSHFINYSIDEKGIIILDKED